MLCSLAAILVVLVLVFHAATYLLWHYEQCRSGACGTRMNGSDVGPWLLEGLALLLVVATWPLGVLGSRKARPRGGGRPVLLVAGWGLNRASLALLAARLRRDGRVVHAAALPWRSTSLDEATAALTKHLSAVVRLSDSLTVDVVAFGLAGVLVRKVAQNAQASSLLGHVVTVASPHRGTALALLGRAESMGKLRPGSAFLDTLVRGERFPVRDRFASIASPFDAIVFPFDLAYCPGAFNVTVERMGHFSMLYSERVYALIAENLAASSRVVAT